MTFRTRSLVGVGVAVATAFALTATAGPASAHSQSKKHVVFVAKTGSVSASNQTSYHSCSHPNYNNIQQAIEAAPGGGTVVVCRGTYPGMVNVDKRITLAGNHGAVINASGDAYGIGVSASWSTVTGMTVKNASPLDPDNGALADGIATLAVGSTGPMAADHVRIVRNYVTGNLGSGIDINSSSYSLAWGNVATANGVGINLADDIGRPANHNTVVHNITNLNFGGCGIALADHTGAGVNGNWIAFNRSDNNGLKTATAPDASAGSGVILASPIPNGTVKNNSIVGNEFHGNGHGGVVVHAHAPGSNFSGNSVTYNRIGTNNVRTDENDLKTTGIYLGSLAPMTITVAHNIIGPDYYAFFLSGPVTVHRHSNVGINVQHWIGSAPNF